MSVCMRVCMYVRRESILNLVGYVKKLSSGDINARQIQFVVDFTA